MIAGILHGDSELSKILETHASFPEGEKEREIVEKQIDREFNTPTTTSAGRYLDAVSSLLDVCHERDYEGEPAMKLESFARRGSPLSIEPELKSYNGKTVLDIQSVFRKLIELKESGEKRENIAATAQDILAKGMTRIAIKYAEEKNIDTIGFTGGVAYNDAIGWRIRKMVNEAGLEYVTNEKLPCGDGGVSFGQLIVAANS